MVWIGIGILLLLLAIMPIRLLLAYSKQEFSVSLKIGLLSFSVLPRKAGKHRGDKDKSSQTTPTVGKKGEQTRKTDINGYLRILRTVLDLLVRLRSKVVMRQFNFVLILAVDDPADLAMLYGRAQGVLAVLLAQIEDAFNIQKRNVQIECDFVATKTTLEGLADISITFGRLLLLAAKYGTIILREYFAILNNKKAVQ